MALELIARAKREGWKRLDLGNCGIVGSVPEEIGELEDLEVLILSAEWWEWGNGDWDHFKSGNVGTINQISELPENLPFNLSVLIFAGNPVRSLVPLGSIRNIQAINLDETNVDSLDPLRHMESILEISSIKTPVSNLSPLTDLITLERLFLSDTLIETIAPLSKLIKLELLWIEGTKINDLSPLRGLRSLTNLSLNETPISNLGPLIMLHNLEILELDDTEISDLSPLKGLHNLKELSARNTKLVDISPLEHLQNLESLFISGTMVADLRPLMHLISKRLFLDTSNSPCEIPFRISKMGGESVLRYLNEIHRIGAKPTKELKIFLLGNTTAGKSTLSHALIHNEYRHEMNSTEGANLSQKLLLKDKSINIWDFGGQEYFHATHRLLMNDDAIYIVVADPKFNQGGYHKTPIRYIDEAEPMEEDLEHFPQGYWLETIQPHASRSSVMMVWNKLDQENCPKYGLSDADKALFDQNIQEYPISLKRALETQTPIWQYKWRVFRADLYEKIEATLQGKQVIQYWPSVREAVEERSKTDIRLSWAEFEALCKADDPLRELGNIVIYLRDMCGAILYFGSEFTGFTEFSESRGAQGAQDEVLEDVVFINPNKINELIYAVLNRRVKKDGGRFSHEHAVRQVENAPKRVPHLTLGAADPESLTVELLAVMKQFGIIFETAKGSRSYVAPQYLPAEVPKEVNFTRKNIRLLPAFSIRFKSFVPRHILPRFIARNGGFAIEEGYWKTGILFSRDEIFLQVQVDYDAREIKVEAAKGEGRMAAIRTMFQELRTFIGRDDSIQVATEGGRFADYSAIVDAEMTLASKLRDVNGEICDLTEYNLFMERIVDTRAGMDIGSQPKDSGKKLKSTKMKVKFHPTIGIITALPKEYAMMRVLLDSPHEVPANGGRGTNKTYTAGTIPGLNGSHSVVLGLLEDMGNNLAATNAAAMLAEFQSIVTVVMVGIAGGVPHPEKPADHVRLGDIVCCDRNGVIQYDLVKETEEWVQHRHAPRAPSSYVLHAAGKMEANEIMGDRPYLKHLQKVLDTVAQAQRPTAASDRLASSDDPTVFLTHPNDPDRVEGRPRVFKGPIASANKLLKNPKLRDKLRDTFGVKAVEMEGSGIADATWHIGVDYFIVRGICDYCDLNKADDWQLYAAAVAAAYTRALLELVPGSADVVAPTQVTPATASMGHSGFDPTKPGKKVLISYSAEDELYRAELAKHLSVMERNGDVQIWYQSKTRAGEDVAQVQAAMEAADVVLLLLSVDYLSSKEIWEQELTVALARRAAGLCTVTGIVLYPCDWTSTPLGKIAMMQRGAAVGDVKNHAAWAGVVGELKGMIGGEL